MPRDPKKIPSIIFHDWETSGLDSQKNAVMSLAMVAINAFTLEEIFRYDTLIKPYDENLIYEPQALAVNGLSIDKCENDGITLKQLVSDMCEGFKEANLYNSKQYKPLLCSHNFPFDRNFTQSVFEREEEDLEKYVDGKKDHWGRFQPNGLDSIHWAKMKHGPLTENTDNFKLPSCCNRENVEFNGDAHTAIGDTVSLSDLMKYYITRLRSGQNVSMENGIAKVNHRNKFEW